MPAPPIRRDTPAGSGGALLVRTPAPRPEWRAILAADLGALPEKCPEWVDALCADGRFTDASRLYDLPDGRRFVLPLLRRRGPIGLGGWLSSYPPACGIGGLVGAGLDPLVVTAVLNELRATAAARIWIRPDPLSAATWSAAHPDAIVVPRRAHVIDLTGGADAVLSRMPASTRRGLRVAQRAGVRIEIDPTGRLLPDHYRLVHNSVQRWARHQHEPLPLARLRARRRDPPTKLGTIARHLGDAFVLLVAYVSDRPAASLITLLGSTAHDIRAAMDRDLAGPVRANELLQWQAIQLACARGCTTYHLGESGHSPGLSHFKERFGAVPVPYAEYRLERLPYTRLDDALRRSAKAALHFRDTRPDLTQKGTP